jgi:RNA polymerase sigma-70 factor (ECF subfamily)
LDDLAARIAELIPRLRRYARALTGERAAADDLVQDTLERAWRKLALWRPGSDLRAWLFTIMHNVHANQVRGRRPVAQSLDDTEGLAGPSNVAQASDLIDLEHALVRLPEDQRAVLLLVGLEQFSYQEAAGVLGVPIGTVMSRLYRARERMKELLDGSVPAQSLRVVK